MGITRYVPRENTMSITDSTGPDHGRAQITMIITDGEPPRAWRLFVAFSGRVGDWPTAIMGPVLPDTTQRARVLWGFGWEITPGSVWTWTEDESDDGTPILTGQVDVRRIV